MWIPDFIVKMLGRSAAKQLNLQEGTMLTKPWYQSKTVWSDIITILMAILGFVDKNWTGGHITGSPFYSMALTFLGAMGIYSRSTATTTISS